MCRYDKDLIMQDVNMLDVLNKLNISVSSDISRTDISTGNKRKVLCPFHNDKHFGSASIYIDSRRNFKGIHCFACGESYNVIKIVQHCLGVNYGAALEWLAECNGNKARYKIKSSGISNAKIVRIASDGKVYTESHKETANKKKSLAGLLTTADLELIGITNYPVKNTIEGAIINCYSEKPEEIEIPQGCMVEKTYFMANGSLETEYLIVRNQRYDINTYLTEDPEGAVIMLLTKIAVLLKEKTALVQQISNSNSKLCVNVTHLTKKEIRKLHELYDKILFAWNENNISMKA